MRRNATARVSSPASWTPRASRQRAARRRLRRRWRRVPPAQVGDALASVAGRAARDSLAVGAETPPSVSAKKWWAANHAEAVLDPLDEHVSPDGVPGGRARDPLPRLLGLEPEPKRAVPPRLTRVSLDDSRQPLGSAAGSRFTTPTKLATPDARARVEARVREAASAAKSPGFGSALKRRFEAASANVDASLDAAATSIRKEASPRSAFR